MAHAQGQSLVLYRDHEILCFLGLYPTTLASIR